MSPESAGNPNADRPDFDALIPPMYEWRNDPEWVSYKNHTDR